MEETQIVLNQHNKEEFRPAHTAEHILNQTMVRMFGCPRSMNAHVEKKKSKCDYELFESPTEEQVKAIEEQVNKIIQQNLAITTEFIKKEDAADIVDLRKLPSDASETLRIVRIGDYDACACIGAHVEHTSEIGIFSIISHEFTAAENSEIESKPGKWRLRWKVSH